MISANWSGSDWVILELPSSTCGWVVEKRNPWSVLPRLAVPANGSSSVLCGASSNWQGSMPLRSAIRRCCGGLKEQWRMNRKRSGKDGRRRWRRGRRWGCEGGHRRTFHLVSQVIPSDSGLLGHHHRAEDAGRLGLDWSKVRHPARFINRIKEMGKGGEIRRQCWSSGWRCDESGQSWCGLPLPEAQFRACTNPPKW